MTSEPVRHLTTSDAAVEALDRAGASLRHVSVDRAVYVVDDARKTYWFERRNPRWQDLSPEESARNQRTLEGYTRVFRSGKTRVFHYDDAPSRAKRARGAGHHVVPE